MLIASKNDRRLRAMGLKELVNQRRGIVQGQLPGCEPAAPYFGESRIARCS
jgi:hypothetical protein